MWLGLVVQTWAVPLSFSQIRDEGASLLLPNLPRNEILSGDVPWVSGKTLQALCMQFPTL